MDHNWLKKMAGKGPFDTTKISLCNSPHMYEITHRHPADNVNCTCECHNEKSWDHRGQV